MSAIELVVMAGGSGTRFWPKSTSHSPKQFLKFGKSNQSLLHQTLARFDGLIPSETQTIVTTQNLESALRDQLDSDRIRILAEPQGRNTAPCLYWAMQELMKKNPDGVMVVMPADSYIPDVEAFRTTLSHAIEWAKKTDDLITLGVTPTRPETGYGYLQLGKNLGSSCVKVSAYIEKPNLENATRFYESKNYLWNGGMFVWKLSSLKKAFDQHMPEMSRAWGVAKGDVLQAYPNLTATSIDFGIMEKALNVVTFPLDCGWDDLGSWISLENLADTLGIKTEVGTVSGGQALGLDSVGNIIDVPGKLVSLLGVKDLIIVENGLNLMIAHKGKSQDIKQLVDQVKKFYPDKI